MNVCTSGNSPQVNSQCHTLVAKKAFGQEAETKEMKELISRLRASCDDKKAVAR